MDKNKIVIMITFLVVFLIGNAENLGGKIFMKNSDFYFTTKEVNIFEIENEDLELPKKVLNKYKDYNDLDLEELLYGKEYALAMNKNKIMLIVEMSTTLFMDSNFYNNKSFENDFLEQINTYYILGENQFIYAYNEGKLFISNDISLFFDTIKNVKEVLWQDNIFKKLMSKEKEEIYKYYKKNTKEVIKKDFQIKSEAAYGFENEIKKFYYVGDIEKKIKIETINFADILDKGVKIETSLDVGKLREMLDTDFSIFEIKGEEEFYNEIQNKIKLLVNVIEKEGDYLILYTEEDGKEIIESIIKEYEKVFFYNKKLDISEEDEIKEINIPLLNINKYIYIKNNNYIIIGENKEELENIKIGKYYNFEYSNIGTDGKIYNEKIENKMVEQKIEDGIFEETIDL